MRNQRHSGQRHESLSGHCCVEVFRSDEPVVLKIIRADLGGLRIHDQCCHSRIRQHFKFGELPADGSLRGTDLEIPVLWVVLGQVSHVRHPERMNEADDLVENLVGCPDACDGLRGVVNSQKFPVPPLEIVNLRAQSRKFCFDLIAKCAV